MNRSLTHFRMRALILMLLLALPAAFAADTTLFDYPEVSEDVSDISFYQPSLETEPYENVASSEGVRNVIFLIGDGMGFGQMAFARIRAAGPDSRLYMERLPVQGWALTHAANCLVTDSAASGTALACGIKTNNGMLGMDPAQTPYQNILEAAAETGMRTGLVATSAITHATPAAFSCHVPARKMQDEIAVQQLGLQVDVMIAGGLNWWLPRKRWGAGRKDGRDVVAEAQAIGYSFTSDPAAFGDLEGPKVLALLAANGLTTSAPEPPLPHLAAKAIECLTAPGSEPAPGFFLMVEGSQIDWAGHNNESDNTVKQMLLFDLAVKTAVEFAQQDRRTLVLVTADHATGGLAVKDDDGKPEAEWATKGHSGNPVPVLAYGPGSEAFAQILDNTEIPKKIAQLLGVKTFPVPLEQTGTWEKVKDLIPEAWEE